MSILFLNHLRTDYHDIKTFTVDVFTMVNLTSYRYPNPTIQGSRWIIYSVIAADVELVFLDIRVTYGAKFHVGRGRDFKVDSKLLDFSSPDIILRENDIAVIRNSSSIWILLDTVARVSEDDREYFDKTAISPNIKSLISGFLMQLNMKHIG